MKVLIVGNSHASALQEALRAGLGHPEISYDYYVIPGRHSPQLRLRDGLFFHASEKLRTSIDHAITNGLALSPFDAILISAVGPIIPNKTGARHSKHPLVSLTASTDGALQFFSRTFTLSAIKDNIMTQSGAYRFAVDAKSVFSGPVFVQPCPFPSERLFDAPQAPRKADWQKFAALQAEAVSELVKDFVLLPQDEQTLAEFGITKAGYQRYRDGLPTGSMHAQMVTLSDGLHMNQTYGQLVLKKLQGALLGQA